MQNELLNLNPKLNKKGVSRKSLKRVGVIKNRKIMDISNDFNNFKVEELEQRLEMGKWRSTSEFACTGGDCRGTIGGS